MVHQLALNPAELIPRVVGRYSPVVVDRAARDLCLGCGRTPVHGLHLGIAVVNTGHCHPRVVQAIQEQAAKIIHAQQNILAHEPMMRAAV